MRASLAPEAAGAALAAALTGPPTPPWPSADHAGSADAWHAVVEAAEHHKLAAVLHRRLAEHAPPAGAPPLGSAVRQRLAVLHAQHALRGRAALDGLVEVLGALRAESVPVILLKGAYLAHAVYPAPGLRSMTDVDLLVPAEAVSRAERALRDLGYGAVPGPGVDYAAHHHAAPMVRYDRLPVELHRSLDAPGSPFRLAVDELWRDARPVSVGGAEALALAPAHLLLHLALHLGFDDRFSAPLRAVYDVALVVRGEMGPGDWARLIEVARAARAESVVHVALALSGRLFGAPVPAATFGALGEGGAVDDDMIATIAERLLARPMVLPEAYRQARDAPGAAARLRVLLRVLVPPLDAMRHRAGPDAGIAVLAGRYAVRLAGLVGRQWALARALRPAGAAQARRQLAREARVERWLDEVTARAAGR